MSSSKVAIPTLEEEIRACYPWLQGSMLHTVVNHFEALGGHLEVEPDYAETTEARETWVLDGFRHLVRSILV
jgi:hypothetical protein